jgi:hypothetical protein
MTKDEELALFDYLARNSKFRDWLEQKLSFEVEALIQTPDVDQLRRAQGRAGLLQQMVKLLEVAPGAVKR